MSSAASFQFLHPLWLLLLAPLWALMWAYARQARRKSMWLRICDPHLLAEMTSQQTRRSGHTAAAWIIGIVLTLGIIASAAPSWSRVSSPLMEASTARVIVLDLSRAMLAEDVRPNRYQHAVAATSELIGNGFDGETGLVVFAGAAFVLAPLSRDADTLQAFVEAMSPEAMPQDGSNIGQAIGMAQDLLSASLAGRGQILLISAGDSNDASAIQAATEAAALGHRVSVLAIGSRAGGPLRDARGALLRDVDGKILLSKSNFDLLQRIATAGEGSMALALADVASGDLLSSRLGANRLVEAANSVGSDSSEAADDGIWLLWLMLPIALLLFRRNVLLVLTLMLLVPGEQGVYASEPGGMWKHAEQVAFGAYQRGEFEAAIELSGSAVLRGAAFYRRGLFAQALEQFSDEHSAASVYNRANTLVQLQRYPEAIAAYQLALELEPGLEAARYNQRLLELFLQQQAAAADGQNSDADGDPASDGESQDDSTMRIGIATEMNNNPADDQQPEAGTGASQQTGQVDPMERFDGTDSEQARFILRAQGPDQAPPVEFIERWITSLPETSTELYRRKFLRDFQRQQRQSR